MFERMRQSRTLRLSTGLKTEARSALEARQFAKMYCSVAGIYAIEECIKEA